MAHPLLRPARPEDLPALSRFARESFQETFVDGFAIAYPRDDLAAYLDLSCSVDAFARRMAEPGARVWVATDADGGVDAYAVAGPAEIGHADARAQDGEIHRFYVHPGLQGTGFAGRALDEVLDALDPRGDRRLWLSVWSGNLRAQRFYLRRGFVHAGEHDYRVGRHVDLDFIYRRDPKAAGGRLERGGACA